MKGWRNFEKEHAIRKYVNNYYRNRRYGDTQQQGFDNSCNCGNNGNNINNELVGVVHNLKEAVWQINNGIQRMSNELELANDYRGLSLKDRIKLLLGKDVYKDPHSDTSNKINQ